MGRKKIINNTDDTECIILNKAFEGSWNEEDGNISHEIIDFFLADDGINYVYNSPHGIVNDRIKNGKATAKYLLITSPAKEIFQKNENGEYIIKQNTTGNRKIKQTESYSFYLLYCIKLGDYIKDAGNYIQPSKQNNLQKLQNNIIIIKNKTETIKYNNVPLTKIFENGLGSVPLVTFRENKLYKFNNPVPFNIPAKDVIKSEKEDEGYNYKRACGYIFSDIHNNIYDKLIGTIKDNLTSKNLKIVPLNKVSNISSSYKYTKTFLDLILKQDSEECYTNMFYNILQDNNIFIEFLKTFDNDCKKNPNKFDNLIFDVKRENKIVNGRMDICATSKNNEYRVVIENKIHSGLNGVDKKSNETQLNQYHNWAKECTYTPICFIMAPDYKVNYISNEIKIFDPNMSSKFKIIPYSKIKDFINSNKNYITENNTLINENYINDIICAFANHSYTSKEEKIRNDFLQEIEKHTTIKKTKIINIKRQIKSHQIYKLGNIKNNTHYKNNCK